MPPRRRALLAALATIGLGGTGVGYWQRRAIRRRDDVDAIEATLAEPIPSIAEPVAVTDEHLEAAHDWAREHVETTEATIDESARPDRLDDAWGALDREPADVEPDEALDALGSYRLAVAVSATVRGRALEPDSGAPSDELRDANETLGDELEAFERRYASDSLSRVVVQGSHAEARLGTARSRHSRAVDYLADDSYNYVGVWETVETGRYARHDAAWFFEALDTADSAGPDRVDDFGDRYDVLDERVESATAAVDWEYEPDVASQAHHRWIDVHISHSGEPDDPDETDRPASAVEMQAERATVAMAAPALDDLPGWRELGELDVELVDDPAALVDEKRAALDELAAASDAVGSDPLGLRLLDAVVRLVELGDTTLDRLRSDVTEYDDAEWQRRLDRTLLRYRSAAAEARTVPEVVDVVADD